MCTVLHHHLDDRSILHRHVVHLPVVQLWIPCEVSMVQGKDVDPYG